MKNQNIEDLKVDAFSEDFGFKFTNESDLDIRYAEISGNLYFHQGVLEADLTRVVVCIVHFKTQEVKVKFEGLKLISKHLKQDFENELKQEYLRLNE